MAKILGLDLGTNSIGWGLLSEINKSIEEPKNIIGAGVNNFPEGVTPKDKEPRNIKRRLAKGVRTQTRRRSKRKELLAKVLRDLGWMPQVEDKGRLKDWLQLNPYELRKKALDTELGLQELGRVLYHLNQRRGFESNLKANMGNEDAKKAEGVVKTDINNLRQNLHTKGFRTLGEYLASIDAKNKNIEEYKVDEEAKKPEPCEIERIRNRYTSRDMFKEEFDLIWEKQSKKHSQLKWSKSNPEFEELIHQYVREDLQEEYSQKNLKDFIKNHIIFYQRELKPQTPDNCNFEPKEIKIPRSAIAFQEIRLWQFLGNIRVSGQGRRNEPLTPDEKRRIFEEANFKKEFSIGDIKKWLNLKGYSFNYKDQRKQKGNTTVAKLSEVFGQKTWINFSRTEQEAIWEVLHHAKNEGKLRKEAKAKWQLTEEQIDDFVKVYMESYYGELSQKAIQNILPYMNGEIASLDYTRACEEVGYQLPNSHLLFQEFRLWQFLANIRIEEQQRSLTDIEKKQAFAWISFKESFTIQELKTYLKLESYTLNYTDNDKIKGNTTVAQLIAIVGQKQWQKMSSQEQEAIWKTIRYAPNKTLLRKEAEEKWKFKKEQLEKLDKIELELAYASLSKKIIEKILPYMNGQLAFLDYEEACQKAGYQADELTKYPKNYDSQVLPPPRDVRNPIVNTTLKQLRRLVNQIIRKYGKPDIVRIELARELKMPKAQRDKIKEEDDRRGEENRQIEAILYKRLSTWFNATNKVTRNDKIKYKLWLECNRTCPYTGKSICLTDLYGALPKFDIEHIIPRKRSWDDSFQNKTLCESSFNLKKGDDMPFEMKEKGSITQKEYEAIIQRVKQFNFKNIIGDKEKKDIFDVLIECRDKKLMTFTEYEVIVKRLEDTSTKNILLEQEYKNILKKVKEALDEKRITETDEKRFEKALKKMQMGKKFFYSKYKRFVQEKVDEDFKNSQLTDTAYIAKEAKVWLESIFPKVEAVNGQSTAELRRLWELNGMLRRDDAIKNPHHRLRNLKNREDHRHHALDALVVACTSQKILKKLSTHRSKVQVNRPIQFPIPIGFKEDIKEALKSILVYHRIKVNTKGEPKTNGELHDATFYAKVNTQEEVKYGVRKSLSGLTRAMVEDIADEKVKEIIKERITEIDKKTKAKKGKYPPKGWLDEKIYMPRKDGDISKANPIKKVRIHLNKSNMVPFQDKKDKEHIWTHVEAKANHHMIIYEKADKSIGYETVSRFEAARRESKKEAVIQTVRPEGERFLNYFVINEMILLKNEDINIYTINFKKLCFGHPDLALISKYLYRVQKMDKNGYIILRHHISTFSDEKKIERGGNEIKINPGYISKKYHTLTKHGYLKVVINVLGEIQPAPKQPKRKSKL